MKPIEFHDCNVTYAEDQPQYLPLPVHQDADGVVTSCWKLTWRERFIAFVTGKFYISQMTFNRGLQPIRPFVDEPNYDRDEELLVDNP